MATQLAHRGANLQRLQVRRHSQGRCPDGGSVARDERKAMLFVRFASGAGFWGSEVTHFQLIRRMVAVHVDLI